MGTLQILFSLITAILGLWCGVSRRRWKLWGRKAEPLEKRILKTDVKRCGGARAISNLPDDVVENVSRPALDASIFPNDNILMLAILLIAIAVLATSTLILAHLPAFVIVP